MKYKRWSWAFQILFLVVIAYFSSKAPLYGDDTKCLYDWVTGERIDDVRGIANHIIYYYNNVEGRLFSYILMHFFVRMPRFLWGICNAVVVMILVHLIARFAWLPFELNGIEEKAYVLFTPIIVVMDCLLFWFFCPALHDLVFWECGSIVYLWMNTFAVLLFYLYFKRYCSYKSTMKRNRDSAIDAIVFFFVGLFAGGSVEATACVVVFGLALYIIWTLFQKRVLTVAEICGAVGGLLGFGVIFLSPGTYARMGTIVQYNSNNVVYEYVWRFFRATYYSLINYLPLIALIACLLYLGLSDDIVGLGKKQILYKCVGREEVLFFVFYLVSTYVMVFSNGYSQRVLQIQQFLLMITVNISVGSFLYNYYVKNGEKKAFQLRSGLFLLFAFLIILWLVEAFTGVLVVRNGEVFTIKKAYWYINEMEMQGIMPGNGSN